MSKETEKLTDGINRDVNKIEKAKREQHSVLSSLAYLTVLGLMFIIPVIFGAYLGVWLDNKFSGFSISWTITLIIIGVFIGVMNVYFLLREK
jgi:ATP synthase protein I